MSDRFVVHQYLHGGDACNLNRLLLPARYCGDELRREGIVVITNDRIPNDGMVDGNTAFDAFVWHGLPEGFERIIGVGTRWQIEGKQVVWSIDDDYRCIPSWNPVKLSAQMYTVCMWSVRSVNHILASTRTLAQTMGNRPVSVAPNLIEPNLYEPWPRDRAIFRIMFAGSPTHIGDLDQIVEAVTTVLNKYPHVEFVFMGCAHPEIKRRHLYQGVVELPSHPLKDYWNSICCYAPDVWVCPLVDCEFNRSKSFLKAIEGMALGAAVVASDVQPYRDCISSGHNGVLVDPEDGGAEWSEVLCRMVEDEQWRKNLIAAGLETVQSRYNWHREECRRPWMEYYRSLRVPF